jgi:hypothetical protein
MRRLHDSAPALLRLLLWVFGGALLLQGAVSAAVGLAGVQPPSWTSTLFTVGTLHGLIHTGLATALLALPALDVSDRVRAAGAIAFGLTSLAMGGTFLLVDRPLGMPYDPSQNVAHFIDGSLAILLGLWILLATRSRARVAPATARLG